MFAFPSILKNKTPGSQGCNLAHQRGDCHKPRGKATTLTEAFKDEDQNQGICFKPDEMGFARAFKKQHSEITKGMQHFPAQLKPSQHLPICP